MLDNCNCMGAKQMLINNILPKVDGSPVPPDSICDPVAQAAILAVVADLIVTLNNFCP